MIMAKQAKLYEFVIHIVIESADFEAAENALNDMLSHPLEQAYEGRNGSHSVELRAKIVNNIKKITETREEVKS